MPRLNDKQALYARLYVENGLDGPRAAKDAGYSTRSAESISSQLKRKPPVQAEIERLLHQVEEKSTVEAAEIIQALRKIAFAKEGSKVNNSDRLRALELMGRYLALWSETINLGIQPLLGADMSNEERAELEDTAAEFARFQADQRRRKALAPAQPDVVAEVLDAGPEAVEQGLPGAPDVADGAGSGPAKPVSTAQKEGM